MQRTPLRRTMSAMDSGAPGEGPGITRGGQTNTFQADTSVQGGAVPSSLPNGTSTGQGCDQELERANAPDAIAFQVENGDVRAQTASNVADSPQQLNYVLADEASEIAQWKPWSFHPIFILGVIVGLQLVQVSLICWVLSKDKTIPRPPIFTFGDDYASAYLAWRLIPVMSAVLLGFLWGIVDLNVRRLEPFHQMSLRGGATIKSSLSLDYGSTVSLFVPFISLWRRHYFVALSSTIYLLAFLVLPVIIDNMWEINYDTNSRVFTVVVSEGWVYATLGLTAVMAMLAKILTLAAQRRKYGLVADPAGLAGLASMIYDSSVLEGFKAIPACETQAFIDTKLQNCRFALICTHITPPGDEDRGPSIWVNQIVSSVEQGRDERRSPDTGPRPPLQQPAAAPSRQSRWAAHPWPLSGRFFLLTSLLLLGPYIAVQVGVRQTVYSSTHKWSPRVMRSLFLLSTTILTANWTLIDADVRLVEPWRVLSLAATGRGIGRRSTSTDTNCAARTTEALIVDWERLDPVSTFCVGLGSHGGTLVAWVSLGSLLSQFTTVVYPALFDSLWKVVYTLFTASVSADYAPGPADLPQSLLQLSWILRFVSYPLVFLNSVIWLCLFSRRRPVVPRKPETLASKIVYLCGSKRLLSDVRDASAGTVKERAKRLRAGNKKYGFGWLWDDEEGRELRLGVEREPLVNGYVYGKVEGWNVANGQGVGTF